MRIAVPFRIKRDQKHELRSETIFVLRAYCGMSVETAKRLPPEADTPLHESLFEGVMVFWKNGNNVYHGFGGYRGTNPRWLIPWNR